MQNLTTTLIDDIQQKRKIILPAGKALFNWVDVKNIGEMGALFLDNFEDYKNQAFDITGYENENFYTVVNYINEVIEDTITYKAINPLSFFLKKSREGTPVGKIAVMILLHYSQRFDKPAKISDAFEKLTGKTPTTLKEFI